MSATDAAVLRVVVAALRDGERSRVRRSLKTMRDRTGDDETRQELEDYIRITEPITHRTTGWSTGWNGE